MAWKDLSIAQRSQLMNLMRHNGISSLSEMRRLYDLSSPPLSSLGENTFNMQPQAPVYAGGGNKFKTGGPEGDKGANLANFEYEPQNDGLPDELFKGVPYKPGDYVKLKSGKIVLPGFYNIDQNVRGGAPYMYTLREDPRVKYLKNKDTGEYFEYTPRANPDLDLSKYDEVTIDEIKKALPKRDYIGGDGYRLRTAQRIPGFIEEVGKRAKAYGLDPNVLLHRIMQEGYIDQMARGYNDSYAVDQKDFFTNPRIWTDPINGYGSFGLDYVGDELMKGLYTLKDPNATWTDRGELEDLEGGVHRIMHHSPQPDNLQSAIEMMAASMAYRQQQAIKMYPDAKNNPGLYVNASYNMGLNNSKMKDPEFVRRKYAYPNYGVFDTGGNKKKKEGPYARKYREEQEAKAKRAREHHTLNNAFRHDIASESGDEYYDVINARYTQAMDALKRRGFSYEDSLRLAPLIVTQNIVEGGWRVARPDDNNFGGLRENGRFLKFNSPEEYYDNYLDLLDRKWGPSRGTVNNWRNAQNLDDWSRILNREDLRLWSKERYNDYNKEHRDNPVYLYAPEWENGGRSYRSHLAGVEARVNTYLDMVLKENPYTMEMYNATTEPAASQNDNFNLSMNQFQDLLEYNREDFGKGGHKIHIKPENRGKFTALKKRTGKSASWFKAHGTPAQKKMAIFALNSRHWGKKKLHGGIKF